jgi:acyl-CoA synthetase (AMP-forming)/AMP-acid ligase II
MATILSQTQQEWMFRKGDLADQIKIDEIQKTPTGKFLRRELRNRSTELVFL